MRLHEAVHAGGVGGNDAPIERCDGLERGEGCRGIVELRHRQVVRQPGLAKVSRLLPAGGDVAAADLGGVILGLGVAKGKRRRFFGCRQDVRYPIGVAPNQGLLREQVG